MTQLIGGCLCGQVRYSGDAESTFVGVCHCKDCQKETGTAFNTAIGMPQSALSIQGSLKTYTKKADSGQDVVRQLCPNCGSTILSELLAIPGIWFLRVGTLDDNSWVKPIMEIYCDSKQFWVELGGDMRRFPKMPHKRR